MSAQPAISPILLGDPTLPHVQKRIQGWLDTSGGFPPNDSGDEYQSYVERCYSEPRDRRKFFENMMREGTPSVGYKALALLIEAGHFRWMWTTNFDDLLDKARSGSRARIVRQVGMDTNERVLEVEPDDVALHHVFLHGDYKYDSLKNTAAELQALDAAFRTALVDQCKTYPLVVVGYSGRDKSVMDSLDEAYSKPGVGGLYWLIMRGSKPSDRVRQLIEKARAAGRSAAAIEFDGFDDFSMRLAKYLLRESPWAEQVEAISRSQAPPRTAFTLRGYRATPDVLKSNSWPITVPDFLHQIEVPTIKTWRDLHNAVKPMQGRVVAALENGKVIALGEKRDLETCFGAGCLAKLEQFQVNPEDMFWEDGPVVSALREAVVRCLSTEGLRIVREGRRWSLVDLNSRAGEPIGSQTITHFRSVEVRLEQRGGLLYLSLIPDRYIARGSLPEGFSKEEIAAVKTRLLVRQYNSVFNQELNDWRRKLGVEGERTVIFPRGNETGFLFKIMPGPVFTQIVAKGAGADVKPAGNPAVYRYKAYEGLEPELLFARGQDVHPIRGLLKHGPIELRASGARGKETIRLGVVCPSPISGEMSKFLRALNYPHPAVETKLEYLPEYPGFAAAFQTQLEVPGTGDPAWVSISANPKSSDIVEAFKETFATITRAIDRVVAGQGTDVVIIFVSPVWASFEKIERDGLDLDLHDQIKSYCAVRGIRTQLIRKETIAKRQRAEVLWWLSLAVYAKSLRTPWMLAKSDEDVAYVGIGYAMNRQDSSKPIVLGCSHVFQSSGLGLRFQLTHIREPIFKRRTPYLSRDDALQVGVQTRQLFIESLGRLPRRVLICKRTPFIKDELDGLRSGLHDIESVDMVTIEYEPAWRYIASEPTGGAAGFPVRRGTAVLIDDEAFLLWVHGRVDRINERGSAYYKGKTRIPTPLRVRRYNGSSSIEQVVQDMLGLSKMDWNTFDFYEAMPAHVTTPGKIARIGRLMERLTPTPLDYRLFM